MSVHRIRKGLDIPISGAPEQSIQDAPGLTRIAILGDDTPGLRARLQVEEGQSVRRGQLLFEDRANPGVRYTAPGAGRKSCRRMWGPTALIGIRAAPTLCGKT